AGRRIRYGGVLALILVGLIFAVVFPLTVASAVDSRTCPLHKGQENLIGTLAEPALSNCQARYRLFSELRDDTEIRQISVFGYDLGKFSGTKLALYQVYQRRMGALAGQLVLLTIAAVILMRLFARDPNHPDSDKKHPIINYSPGTGVALLLIAVGAVITFVPDVIYLIDNFGNRMNTIFKLYYQSWALFSIGAAYAVFAILNGAPTRTSEETRLAPVSVFIARGVYAVGLLYLLWAGVLYPYYAVRSRALDETNLDNELAQVEICREAGVSDCPDVPKISLDAGPTITQAIGTDEWVLINDCFMQLEPRKNDAVLVETPGGGYTPHLGRVSMLTGIPTLLGWDNHERQWRGDTYPDVAGNREGDIFTLYTTEDWNTAQDIIDKYGIDYVMVGNAEFNAYGGQDADGLSKFAQLLDPVCKQGNVALYRVSAE
ncbi:MAG: hypothetical protein HY862_09420, partial [Chloroflexi bacterium]|nr:hypothetical protein [Chloroflexota bacterium]